MKMTQVKDTRSASQKITDLENALMSLYQTADNMARDLGTIKEAIKLLGNKMDSIVKAASAGEPVNDEVIARIMIENNVEELNQRVKAFIAQGILGASEQINQNSFVVGSENDDQGKVINPRLQFALFALDKPEVREKFIGGRVGDVLNLEEGKLKFRVQEIYQILKGRGSAEEAAAASSAPANSSAAPEAAPAEAAVESAPAPQPDQSVTPA